MIEVLLFVLALIAIASLVGGITIHGGAWLFVVLVLALLVGVFVFPRRGRRL